MIKRGNTVLVTGSTGFLGSAVTQRLLASGYKLKLLIRKNNDNNSSGSYERENTIKEHILRNQLNDFLPVQDYLDHGREGSLYDLFLNNVEIYEGDITTLHLGLKDDEYRKLCYEVDEVFHCAAATHFESQPAEDLMKVNVNGTVNMLRFASAGRQKRFHYISTAYIAGSQGNIVYEQEPKNEPVFNNEYERSKFVAEQAVIDYARNNKITFTICRPSIIVGDSRTGETCRFDNFYIFAKVLIRISNGYADQIGEGSKVTVVRTPGIPLALINLVPIDYVADAIVEIMKYKETVGTIFHITNPHPPELSELRDRLLSVLGIKGINVLFDGPMKHRELCTLERLFLRQTKTYYSYLFSRLQFDCRNTQSVLKGTDIVCPEITEGLLRVLVGYAISRNWGTN